MAKVKEYPIIFNKGLNTSITDVGYAPRPVVMDNVWLSRDDRGGAIEQMPGYSSFHTFVDDDVAIQTISSAGVKENNFNLYALGGTKFYRYSRGFVTFGDTWNDNIATKTGLTDGRVGTILIAGDVDGEANAWVFNGVDTPFLSNDEYANYDDNSPYNISDIGVARPYADNYAVGDATDRIYIVAGDADSGPSVQFYYAYNNSTYTDQTTAANNDTVDDVDLGPSSGWSEPDKDGHFVASDTPFGGVAYNDFTPQATGTSKYTWEYWNGSGWQKFRDITDGTNNMEATDDAPEVTWTIPSGWVKSKVNGQGPYFWMRCRKTSGVIGAGGTTCSRVFLLDQQFGEDEAEGIVQYYMSKVDGTSESALSTKLKQADGTEGIDAGVGGTVKVVIDKSAVTGAYAGDDPNGADYYKDAVFKVYRTYEDGAQPYDTGLRIETDTSSDGEVEDNIPDNELGNLPYLHGDVPPVTILPALSHFARIFGLDPSNGRLYWSDLANPESFWTDENGSWTPVFPGDNDEGVALARDRDGVLVFKKNHLYKLVGRTPDQFYATEITLADPTAKSVGAPSVRAICYTPSGIVFYWNKGVYIYSGSYPVKISGAIDEDLRGIDSKCEESEVCIGYYAARNQVYLSVPLGGSTPSHTYIFDMDVNEWCGRMTTGFRQFLSVTVDADTNVNVLEDETGELFLGVDHEANGQVFQLDDTILFDTYPIESNITLSPFFGSSMNKLKTFLYVDIIFEPVADGYVDLGWWINGESGDPTTKSVSLAKTGYGVHRRRVNIGYMGRDLTIKMGNTYGYSHDWKIYGLVVGYQEHDSFSL